MKGKRILLVEDDPDIQRFVADVLRLEGATTVVAGDGKAGLDASTRQGPFDLIVLDLDLPDVSGWEVMASILAAPSPPIAILTASAADASHERAASLGAAAYIVKPVSARELVQALRACIG